MVKPGDIHIPGDLVDALGGVDAVREALKGGVEWTTSDPRLNEHQPSPAQRQDAISVPAAQSVQPVPTQPGSAGALTLSEETVAKWRDGPWSASLFQIPEGLVQIVGDARLATAAGMPVCVSLPSDDLAIPPLPFNALRWST